MIILFCKSNSILACKKLTSQERIRVLWSVLIKLNLSDLHLSSEIGLKAADTKVTPAKG